MQPGWLSSLPLSTRRPLWDHLLTLLCAPALNLAGLPLARDRVAVAVFIYRIIIMSIIIIHTALCCHIQAFPWHVIESLSAANIGNLGGGSAAQDVTTLVARRHVDVTLLFME